MADYEKKCEVASDCITFVCCIEAGALEENVWRLAESIRRWGGRLADSHIIAVSARRGLALRRQTVERLSDLDVELVRDSFASPIPWFPIYNKAVAVKLAERLASTRLVCFLDSDVLVLAEPTELVLPGDVQFAACPHDLSGATCGPGDANEAYWAHAADLLGVELDRLPMVLAPREQRDMRMYFNSGVFVFERTHGFGEAYADDFLRLIKSGYRSPTAGIYHTCQVTLPLTVTRLGLPWQRLPLSCHLPLAFSLLHEPARDVFVRELARAKVVHYFRSLGPDQFEGFTSLLATSFPDVASWLRGRGAVRSPLPLSHRLLNKPLYEWRKWRYRRFEDQCQLNPHTG